MLSVLIVDDEKKARDFLAGLLSDVRPDVEIMKACNSHEALELLENHNYDILMTDINMPGMDGLQMIESIAHRDKHLFIVLVSALEKFEYAQKAINLGAHAYIVKPLYKDLISDVLEKYSKFRKESYYSRMILFDNPEGTFQLKAGDILAVEIQGKNLLKIYKSDYTMHTIRGTLNEVFLRLPECFIYINRQCFVNHLHIHSFNCISGKITLLQNGKELVFQMSRECNKNIKAFFSIVARKNEGAKVRRDKMRIFSIL
jgi:DNA-binding LytR/AlgR family response regulator